jgi:hypothetical protein
LVVEAGAVALVRAFQGVAALPVVVTQFVVNGAMFLFLFPSAAGRQVAPGAFAGGHDGGYCQGGGTAPASPS